VDGEAHSMGDHPQRDVQRDQWLREQGLHVLRFNARDVITDLLSVLTAILQACRR
jgi:very-short-patch-repair endonuclease